MRVQNGTRSHPLHETKEKRKLGEYMYDLVTVEYQEHNAHPVEPLRLR